jgi:hypothetical protein
MNLLEEWPVRELWTGLRTWDLDVFAFCSPRRYNATCAQGTASASPGRQEGTTGLKRREQRVIRAAGGGKTLTIGALRNGPFILEGRRKNE